MRSPPRIHAAARRLRREMSPPEVLLWVRLRQSRELRVRRQHPLEQFVLDFYCPAARLCIEVDGWGHNMGDQPERDERRDARLVELRIAVLRSTGAGVMADPDGAADAVWRTCRARIGSHPLRHAAAPRATFPAPQGRRS